MDKSFMRVAVNEGLIGVSKGEGGPFGAVIVRGGKVIAAGHNRVVSMNDPTAHAEIVAIRAACRKLRNFHLTDCELYSSCEPCPMCLAAAKWARIKKIYYGSTRRDAEKAGFIDKQLYDNIKVSKKARKTLGERRISCVECKLPFDEWAQKKDKVMY